MTSDETDHRPRKDWERDLNASICAAVREQRLHLGILQATVAAELDLAESTYSRYETGQRVLSAAMLYMIALHLRQPLTAFVPPKLAAALPSSPKGVPSAGDASTPSPALTRVLQTLEQHPELIGSVEALLDEMVAPAPPAR